MWVALKLIKQDCGLQYYNRISAQNNLMLLLKHFITKLLEAKAGLKRIKFVCVAMRSLVMNLCSCDLHVIKYYNTLNSSRLTVVYLTQSLVFGW